MLNKQTPYLLALFAGGSLVAACQTKGPAPGQELATEPVEVTMAEREGDPSGEQALGIPTKDRQGNYAVPHDPHGPAGHLNPPDSHVSGEVKLVDVGGLTFRAPEGWSYEHPGSEMRRAQFGVRSDSGTAGLVVYFFGKQGAGSPQDNIDRWVGQFKNADGKPVTAAKPIERQIAGLKATQIEVAGTYAGGMGGGAPEEQNQTGQRMIATIVETPSGPFYFKFLGDDETVTENRKELEGLLASMKTSP